MPKHVGEKYRKLGMSSIQSSKKGHKSYKKCQKLMILTIIYSNSYCINYTIV